jgi:hypothetical protein
MVPHREPAEDSERKIDAFVGESGGLIHESAWTAVYGFPGGLVGIALHFERGKSFQSHCSFCERAVDDGHDRVLE